ncbi:MAG TPA: MSMEG_1061 family FMN-dependent PPOX-type flavoprotein [Conexibacter sp.]|nr:MSMEG_1061 family FMN-dependent PPOX-type flavoprotein [Conexibacter sp.]
MAELDPFAGAIASEAQLREHYDAPMERAVRKELQQLDEMARRLIAVAPIVLIASHDAQGRCDVTPRGGQPGFVTVLDDDHLAIPDATGNNRLDTLRNVVATGHAGLIFLIPGRDQTLRVNGAACVSDAPELLARLTAVGKPPKTAIVVRAEEVYAHCPKAFVRSRLWNAASWPSAADQPTPAEVSHAHMRDPALSVEDVERQQADALKYRLA